MSFNMRSLLIFLWCIGLAFGASAQEGDWLIKFDNGYTVDQAEFEYVYQKNNGGYDKAAKDSRKDYEDYLDLFVNYKRKVLEAERLKLDTAKAFKAELNRYLKQLAQPYLIEKSVLENLIKEAYDRSAYALNVSHILVKLPKNPTPKDTANAYKMIQNLRAEAINGGKDFSDLAKGNSDDPSAKDNEGYLSWFTVFDFIYGFEDAAFETEVGGISQPVRTEYGYHVIKVHDKKELKSGKPRLAHLLIRAGNSYEAKTRDEAKARIDSIYKALQDGAEFEKLVAEYSDDPNSRNRGGDLGTRYLGVPELQDKKFELKPGKYSEPFETNVGWHIVTVTETVPLKSFDEMESQLKARVSRDPRAKLAEQTLINQLKKEYDFELNSSALEALQAEVEENLVALLKSEKELDPSLAKKTVFSFKAGTYSAQDVMDKLRTMRSTKLAELAPEQRVQFALDEYVKEEILSYEETQLDRKYPDYRNLKREYRDGILLFTLTEDMVWQKAVKDTAGLQAFWEQHKDEYTAEARAEVYTYSSKSEDKLKEVSELLEEYDQDIMVVDSIIKAKRMTVRTNRQFIERAETARIDKMFDQKQEDISEIFAEDGRYYLYLPIQYLPKGEKTFKEAKAQAITDYQNELEKAWLEELEKRYPYKLNDKAFKKLFK